MRLSNEAAGIATQKLSIKDTALGGTCIPDPVCRPSKYRTIDGSCNNLKSPVMGRSNTQLGRYLAPKYDDGIIFIFFRTWLYIIFCFVKVFGRLVILACRILDASEQCWLPITTTSRRTQHLCWCSLDNLLITILHTYPCFSFVRAWLWYSPVIKFKTLLFCVSYSEW